MYLNSMSEQNDSHVFQISWTGKIVSIVSNFKILQKVCKFGLEFNYQILT